MTSQFEVENLQQGGPDAEWAIARLYGNVPLDLFAGFSGLAVHLDRLGYESYFKPETGFQIVWARRKRKAETR